MRYTEVDTLRLVSWCNYRDILIFDRESGDYTYFAKTDGTRTLIPKSFALWVKEKIEDEISWVYENDEDILKQHDKIVLTRKNMEYPVFI